MWRGEKKRKKKKTWRKEQNIYALWWLTPLSLWKQNKERRGGEWESKEGKKKKKAAKWWMMRRMEKQISPSFQSGILMGFVCVTRRRGCLTGLKEIFRVQATDMSIEREPQDSGPMWCGSGMHKTHKNRLIFPPLTLYLCSFDYIPKIFLVNCSEAGTIGFQDVNMHIQHVCFT